MFSKTDGGSLGLSFYLHNWKTWWKMFDTKDSIWAVCYTAPWGGFIHFCCSSGPDVSQYTLTFSFSERWLNLQSVAQHFPTIFKSGFFISFFSLASTFFMLLRDEEVCFFSTPCLQPISLVCKAALSLLLCKHFVLSNSFMLLFLLQILVFLTLLYKFIHNEFLLYCY